MLLSEGLLSPPSPLNQGEDQERRESTAQAPGSLVEGRGIGPPESGLTPVVTNLLSGQGRIRSERMKWWRQGNPQKGKVTLSWQRQLGTGGQGMAAGAPPPPGW